MKRIFLAVFLVCTFFLAQGQQEPAYLRTFSVIELLQDYDSLHSIVVSNHPDLWAEVDSIATEKKWQEHREKINRPMKRWQFLELVAPLVTQYLDGHTNVFYDFDSEEVKDLETRNGKLFPYRVRLYNDSLWITDNWKDSSALYRGSLIQSINDVSIKDIISRLSPIAAADHERGREATISRLFPYLLWAVYGWEDTYKIQAYDPSNKKAQTISTSGLTLGEFMQRQFPRKRWKLELVPDQALAIITCAGYNNYSDGIRFIDSAFAVINKKNISHVAFDIRNNGGGNSSIGDHLLAYITRQPYSDVTSKTLRYGSMMKRFKENSNMYRSMQNYMRNGIQSGDNYTMKFGKKEPDSSILKENFFKGKFYLLTGPITYSSAHMTALAVKSSGMGIILGEPTGERIDLTGENAGFNLPNTKLTGYCALATFEGALINKKDKGVQPDIYIPFNPSTLLSGKDPVIEQLLALIKAGK